MNEQLIARLRITGMYPAQQQRSRLLVLQMMQTGLKLLADRDFDALSVEDICKGAGATIGSFYGRFDSKEIFIHALQRVVVEETTIRLQGDYDSGRAPNDSLTHLLAWISKGAVIWYRNHEGLVRASLRGTSRQPQAWTPMFVLGQTQVQLALPHVLAAVGDARDARTPDAIRFAFQILYGTLNNMVLIDPGPYRLHDDATSHMLAAAMLRLIEPPGAPASRKLRGASAKLSRFSARSGAPARK